MIGGGTVRTLVLAAAGVLGLAWTTPAAACEIDRPVTLAGLNWDSNTFHVAVAARILRDGFGCEVEVAPGTTRPLFRALAQGDIDIMMEVWKDNLPTLWPRALADGSVIELGVNYPDAVQGWFVPRYAVEGTSSPAHGLTSVTDLPRYTRVFADPGDRKRGRFYNCMLGWGCEAINSAKLHAYGLDQHYNNFRPASGAALIRAISAHYERREPFLTYYWGPTWVLGAYDLIMLEEPPYDPEIWRQLAATSQPVKATAYPLSEISIAASAEFNAAAPGISAFLSNYRTNNRLISEALAIMNRDGLEPDAAAVWFLDSRKDIWRAWVPAGIADRVSAALGSSPE